MARGTDPATPGVCGSGHCRGMPSACSLDTSTACQAMLSFRNSTFSKRKGYSGAYNRKMDG